MSLHLLLRWALLVAILTCALPSTLQAASVVGDPGMANPALHVMWEGWSFCNQAGNVSAFPGAISAPLLTSLAPTATSAWYTPGTSPRFADCLSPSGTPLVSVSDNLLSFPDPLPGGSPSPLLYDVNWYAQEKGRALGRLCEQRSAGGDAYEWWTVMIKNGNLDQSARQCPETTIVHTTPPRSTTRLPFSPLLHHRGRHLQGVDEGVGAATKLMNQPLVYQRWTGPHPQDPSTMAGGIIGTFTMTDASVTQLQRCIDADSFPSPCSGLSRNVSFFSSTWTRTNSSSPSSWLFSHQLVTDASYEWLMVYHRADASGFRNGGYDWIAPGMMTLHELTSDVYPHFHLRLHFNVSLCTSTTAQFYLPEVGGCWKTDGHSACDGDAHTDVTRYVNFIVNPGLLNRGSCSVSQPNRCPPTHTFRNGSVVASTNKTHFPYQCYFFYCAPPGSRVPGTVTCDAYSNPNPQELVQILPCSEWTQWGFPAPGQGWVGDARDWSLDAGGLVNTHLYFFRTNTSAAAMAEQPTVTRWVSLEVGPEVFQANQETLFHISAWDIVVNDTDADAWAGDRERAVRLAPRHRQ